MAEDKILLDKIKDKAQNVAESLKAQYGINDNPGRPWPQTEFISGLELLYPKYKTRGWLPPTSIPVDNPSTIGNYSFTDWRGVKLKIEELNIIDKKEKFEESLNIPKSKNEITSNPYSTRDNYLIFGDNSTDYFKHGLQIIDRLSPVEDDGSSNLRLSSFKSTPFENNDPVIFGFDIIIDDISSPLLNGSILDFLNNYSSINEIAARKPVYEDFKQQFIKFFKTKATVRVESEQTNISRMRESGYPESDNNKDIFQSGKKSYMNYYLKKIAGIDKLVEGNTPSAKKYLVDYNKDVITLSFAEDVSLSIGTLAHLYKLLYWSKPNGKGIIPENLLRFNCDIIVSEVRNFKRVRKAIEANSLEIIKDNVSRYIYSLRECQFYFNQMPHDNDVDLGAIKTYDAYSVQFDYKYSSVKFERFVPTTDGFGKYIGYDGGAIWKIGNSGERENRGTQSGGQVKDSSTPKFYTSGLNTLNQTGVTSPFIVGIPEDNLIKPIYSDSNNPETPTIEENIDGFNKFKQNSKAKANELKGRLKDQAIRSTQRELQTFVNTRTALLNRTLNKVLNSVGLTGIRPPKNIYTDSVGAGGRVFYDVRGQLLNFLGDSLGGTVGGGINRSF
jgi:hypothetical protein